MGWFGNAWFAAQHWAGGFFAGEGDEGENVQLDILIQNVVSSIPEPQIVIDATVAAPTPAVVASLLQPQIATIDGPTIGAGGGGSWIRQTVQKIARILPIGPSATHATVHAAPVRLTIDILAARIRIVEQEAPESVAPVEAPPEQSLALGTSGERAFSLPRPTVRTSSAWINLGDVVDEDELIDILALLEAT